MAYTPGFPTECSTRFSYERYLTIEIPGDEVRLFPPPHACNIVCNTLITIIILSIIDSVEQDRGYSVHTGFSLAQRRLLQIF